MVRNASKSSLTTSANIAEDVVIKVLTNHFDASGWPQEINLDKLLSRYDLTSE